MYKAFYSGLVHGRQIRIERAAAFSRHLTVNQHPQASSFESAARHGFPLGAGLRKHAEKLEQDGGGRHAGDAAGVEGRRDLDEIGADEIEAPEIADQTLGFKCRKAARLRRPRAWRIDWIERVGVEGKIGGAAAADDFPHLLGRPWPTFVVKLLNGNHAHATVVAELPHVGGVETAADAHLDHALRIDKSLLDRQAE